MACPETILYNGTGILGETICNITQNVTGSLFLTFLMIVVAMIFIMLIFRIPLEIQTFIILPFLLTLMAYTQEFLVIGGVLFIFIAAVVARSMSRF